MSWIDDVVRDVAELDYNSPEGQPDVMLVTDAELRQILVARAPEMHEGWTLNAAADDVMKERLRQIDAEGYDPAHDDEHVNDEIAALACFYAMPDGARDWDATSTGYGDTLGHAIIPENWSVKTGDRRRELVKAGALILAEIERLDRMQPNNEDQRLKSAGVQNQKPGWKQPPDSPI